MAERRMFSKPLINTDDFMELTVSAKLLYFYLMANADDDGFVNNPKTVMRTIGSTEDDLRNLAGKQYVILFEDGVLVIRHWRIHNYIAKDRYKETQYTEDKAKLSLNSSGAYELDNNMYTDCIQDVHKPMTQVRLGKVSIGKDSLNTSVSSDLKNRTQPKYEILLKDNSAYPIYQVDIDGWKKLYPDVDIDQECRNMIGWCNGNPTKRKTRSGAQRFINGWLAREQSKKPKQPETNNIFAQMLAEGK